MSFTAHNFSVDLKTTLELNGFKTERALFSMLHLRSVYPARPTVMTIIGAFASAQNFGLIKKYVT